MKCFETVNYYRTRDDNETKKMNKMVRINQESFVKDIS